MKIAEIRELATNELAERIQTEEANYTQMLLNILSLRWRILHRLRLHVVILPV